MKFRWEKKYLYWGITAFTVIALCITFYLCLKHMDVLASVLSFVFGILSPFVLGGIFAYLLLPVVKFFEEKVFLKLFKKAKSKKIKTKLPRILAIVLTFILTFAIIAGILVMMLPQLADSIIKLINNLQGYFENLEKWAVGLVSANPSLQDFVQSEFDSIANSLTNWAKTNLLPQMTNILGGITVGVKSVISFLTNLFISIVLSVYILYSREKFTAQLKKFSYSLFPVKFTNAAIRILRRTDSIFGGFITGKIIDTVLVGIVCFIVMLIFNWPFALLISVIIAITNLIPFFGPFIGAIPSALLILMVSGPLECLYFVIFIILLQQIEGNLISPKILGDSTGLSAFWVLFAISVGGGLFGFMGMLIGVPVFSVIYSLVKELIELKLDKKELPVDTNEYVKIDHINLEEDIVFKDEYDNVKIVEEKE